MSCWRIRSCGRPIWAVAETGTLTTARPGPAAQARSTEAELLGEPARSRQNPRVAAPATPRLKKRRTQTSARQSPPRLRSLQFSQPHVPLQSEELLDFVIRNINLERNEIVIQAGYLNPDGTPLHSEFYDELTKNALGFPEDRHDDWDLVAEFLHEKGGDAARSWNQERSLADMASESRMLPETTTGTKWTGTTSGRRKVKATSILHTKSRNPPLTNSAAPITTAWKTLVTNSGVISLIS